MAVTGEESRANGGTEETPQATGARAGQADAPSQPPGARVSGVRFAPPSAWGAPAWVTPLYVGGLVLVYVGERVLSGLERGAGMATALGLLAVIGATGVRFLPRYRGEGDRAAISLLEILLSFGGVLALAGYFATTAAGQAWLGIDALELVRRERVLGAMTVAWIALLGLSVLPMLFAEGALRPMRHAEKPEARRVRMAVLGGLTLTIAAAYAAFFVFAASRLDFKVDYSYFKTSRPSEATGKIAAALPDSVRIVAFFPDVNEVKNEVSSYLDELQKLSPKIKYELKDRVLEPKLASELKVTRDGVIVLSRGKSTETLSLGTELDKAAPKLKTLDKDFQEKLMKLARARRSAYMTVGHGELNDRPAAEEAPLGRTARIAKELLRKQNYEIKDLSLASGLAHDVPEDADIVMILGPSEPFAPEEIASVTRYAERGGHLLLALDPDVLAPTSPVETTGAAPAEPGAGRAAPTGERSTVGGEPRAAPGARQQATEPSQQPKPEAASAAAPARAKGSPAASEPARAASTDTVSATPSPAGETGGERLRADLARTLSELARIAGLELATDLLAHEQIHVRARFNDSDRLMLVSDQFSSHASVSTLSRNARRLAVVVGGSGSLEASKTGAGRPADDDKLDFTLKTARDTFADTNRNYRLDSGTEKGNVHNLAAAVARPKTSGSAAPDAKPASPADPGKAAEPKDADATDSDRAPDLPAPAEMRAFVIADVDVFGDLMLANVPGNQFLLVDAVRWLGGEESFAGAVNTEEDVRIEHTKQKDLIWFYGTIFGAPALVLGLGLVISRRSRRLPVLGRVARAGGGR